VFDIDVRVGLDLGRGEVYVLVLPREAERCKMEGKSMAVGVPENWTLKKASCPDLTHRKKR
jgi:hypothetical protein